MDYMPINLQTKLTKFSDHWAPKIIAQMNEYHFKLVKFKGDFVWHKHDDEDELFYVLNGEFKMEFRDKMVEINENEFLVVPRGVEHRPVAENEVSVMLFEPCTVVNTGDNPGNLTKENLERI